jgi:hypothetical protein
METRRCGYNYVDRRRDRREKFYAIDRHAYPNRRFIGGVDNGQADSHESYQGPNRRAFHGLTLVVLQ